MSTLGAKIKKLREIKGLKQEYMADQLGISINAYSKMEKDETNVSQERLEQISKALEMSIQDILAFDEKSVFNFINNSIHHTHSPGGYGNTWNNSYTYTNDGDKIRLLEELVDFLKTEVERLKAEIEKLKSSK